MSYLAFAWLSGCPSARFYWPPDVQCPDKFSDLFEPIPGVEILDTSPPRGVLRTHNPKSTALVALAPFALRVMRPRRELRQRIARLLGTLGKAFIAVHIRHTDLNSNYKEDATFVKWARETAGNRKVLVCECAVGGEEGARGS